jgi:hypothetical protein
MIKAAIAAIVIASLCLSVASKAGAQDATPTPDDLATCNFLPARVLHLALTSDDETIALVTPVTSYTFDTGVVLQVGGVIKGTLPAAAMQGSRLIADLKAAGACTAARLWKQGEPALAIFIVTGDDPSVFTLAGWPIVDATGAPRSAPDVAGPALDNSAIDVQLRGGISSIADALATATAFVESTPTPLPPGFPTPDLRGPDANAGTPAAQVALPATGTTDGGGSHAITWGIAAAMSAALAVVVGFAGWRWRLRR